MNITTKKFYESNIDYLFHDHIRFAMEKDTYMAEKRYEDLRSALRNYADISGRPAEELWVEASDRYDARHIDLVDLF